MNPLANCDPASPERTFATLAGTAWPSLCCPQHFSPLEAVGQTLRCPGGEEYGIVAGVPRLTATTSYADAFGAQWKKYRLTQLDSHSGLPITQQRLRRCLGDALWKNIRGKHILECGCGAGRFTEILLQQGALVTSIDLSDAVEANATNFPQSPQHRILQADILRLPFSPAQFDIVLCLGVIQHTPNSEEALAALSSQVKPDGFLVVDHYTYNLSDMTKVAGIARPLIKRLSPDRGIRCTEALVRIFLPLHRRVRNMQWMQALLSRISPIVCYYHAYPELSDGIQAEWALLDTHDYLTCWYRRYRTRSQVLRSLKRLGFEETVCEYGGIGVEARAKRISEPHTAL